jgi:DNA polymerase-3 subunit delta'
MSWQHIRGHDSLIGSFEQAYYRGRLGHAYLFVGPDGVGKRLFAHELAKALLCEGLPLRHKLEACDQCPACKLVDAGTHPDLHISRLPDAKSDVSIEIVRELARSLDLKPARGRGRIVILDDADDLNQYSANCFLKTLEEPPPGALLILIGTSAERQLPTIVSRCQVISFRPLPEGIVVELLNAQGIGDQGFVKRLACLSDGSVSLGRALADPALWKFRRRLLEGLTQSRPDGVALAQDWMKFTEGAGKELSAQRRRAGLVLRLLIDFLNDALSMSVGKASRLTEAADLPLLQKMIKQFDTDHLLAMIDRCLEADIQIDRNVQLVLVLEALLDPLTGEAVAK